MTISPPKPRKQPKTIEQLGRTRTDDYAWMKDENWQAVLRDPSAVKAEVREHLTAENAYVTEVLKGTEGLQAALFAEMRGRIKEDDSSVPQPHGEFEYYARYEAGAQHPVRARRRLDTNGTEEVLLDEEAEAKGKPYYQVGGAEHSPDHRLFAWAVDEQGSEFYRLHVKDLESGAAVGGPIESAYGDFAFSACSAFLYWIWRDENARPAKVFRRKLGGSDDVLVYEEPDDGMFLGVGRTSDDAFMTIRCSNQETSELRVLASETPEGEFQVAEPRMEGVRYDADHWSDRWVVRTNADGAVDFKLTQSEAAIPARATWRDLIPHRPGRFIVTFGLLKDYLLIAERADACDQIIVRTRAGGEHAIAFDEAAYSLHMDGGLEYDTIRLRFTYQSPTTPRQTYDYRVDTRERDLRKTQEIPSGHDPAKYETHRLYATAADGEFVPITVLKLRETPLDGSAPLLVYGYGAYGFPQEATFSIRNLSLVDRGWIWALAHTRGGSDKGWNWFLDGKRFAKKNTFTDFIAVTEHLVQNGYGTAGKVAAYGGSAGGMLMGAITNMRPDLYGAIIAAVPFVDVLNTMSDTSLPLTPPEWPEWGNPLEDEAAYDYIASYSPYENVTAQAYPAVLATGGLSDPRVTWWEPEKWTARLRELTTSDRPILLKINMDAGHGGASGRFDFLKEIALDYAFAIWVTEGPAQGAVPQG